jgi:hypothetical protein
VQWLRLQTSPTGWAKISSTPIPVASRRCLAPCVTTCSTTLTSTKSDQIICGTNEQWNEVWWFYPTADSDYNNAYVIYNHLERVWYYGTIDRTAWLDTPIRQYPQAAKHRLQLMAAPSRLVMVISITTKTVSTTMCYPMDSYIQSSDFDLDDGDNFMLTRRILPDVGFEGSTAASPEVTFTVRPRNFPGSSFSADPADTQRVIETTVGTYTDQVFMSVRVPVRWRLNCAPRIWVFNGSLAHRVSMHDQMDVANGIR